VSAAPIHAPAPPAAAPGSPAAAPGAGAVVAAIRLEDVSRVYQVGDSEVRALDRVNTVIERGDFVAIMGPSGSGKSTLLQVLGCLDSPTSGRYVLEGDAVEGLPESRLAEIRQRRIGFVFQSYHLIPRMTAARNVELPLILAGVEPEVRRRRVDAALARVGLADRADHRPDQLSGGERQRVAIARALIQQPAILLADEPTGNLDSKTGREIVDTLEALHHEGLTIVLVTHDPGVAARAHRLLRMRDGCVISEDVPAAAAPAADEAIGVAH
jgi:putative ABC transport system ATP-binding protein